MWYWNYINNIHIYESLKMVTSVNAHPQLTAPCTHCKPCFSWFTPHHGPCLTPHHAPLLAPHHAPPTPHHDPLPTPHHPSPPHSTSCSPASLHTMHPLHTMLYSIISELSVYATGGMIADYNTVMPCRTISVSWVTWITLTACSSWVFHSKDSMITSSIWLSFASFLRWVCGITITCWFLLRYTLELSTW